MGRKFPAVSRRRSLAVIARCRLIMTARGKRAADTPPWCDADRCCAASSPLIFALEALKRTMGADARFRWGADWDR